MSGQPWMPGDVYFGGPDVPLPDWRAEASASDTDDGAPLSAVERAALARMLGFDPRELGVRPPSVKSLRHKYLRKDQGQPCQQGETAARSGCVPANGEVSSGTQPSQETQGKLRSPSKAASVTPSQKQALRNYCGESYASLNGGLRKGQKPSGQDARDHEQLQAVFASLPEHEPVSVYRGIAMNQANTAKLMTEMEKAIESGKPFTMKGYVSTSSDQNVAAGFAGANVLMEIRATRGLDVAGVSPIPQEKEVLLNHGSKFRVAGIEKRMVMVRGNEVERDVIILEQAK